MEKAPFDAIAIAGELLLVGFHAGTLRPTVFGVNRRVSGLKRLAMAAGNHEELSKSQPAPKRTYTFDATLDSAPLPAYPPRHPLALAKKEGSIFPWLTCPPRPAAPCPPAVGNVASR